MNIYLVINWGSKLFVYLRGINLHHTIIACTKSGAVIKNNLNRKEIAIVRGSFEQVKQVSNFNEITEDFVKITIQDPLNRCIETREKLSPFIQSAHIVAQEAAWIDIKNTNVHKGTTVEYLQRLLNVTSLETMVFGDGIQLCCSKCSSRNKRCCKLCDSFQ